MMPELALQSFNLGLVFLDFLLAGSICALRMSSHTSSACRPEAVTLEFVSAAGTTASESCEAGRRALTALFLVRHRSQATSIALRLFLGLGLFPTSSQGSSWRTEQHGDDSGKIGLRGGAMSSFSVRHTSSEAIQDDD